MIVPSVDYFFIDVALFYLIHIDKVLILPSLKIDKRGLKTKILSLMFQPDKSFLLLDI